METGEIIRERRKALKLKVEDVCKYVGIDRSSLYRYETGGTENIPAVVAVKLADILEINVFDLLCIDRKEKLDKAEKSGDETQRQSEYDKEFIKIWAEFSEEQKKTAIDFMKMFKNK